MCRQPRASVRVPRCARVEEWRQSSQRNPFERAAFAGVGRAPLLFAHHGGGHLRGLTAAAARHARHLAVQSSLELDGVQVPPVAAQAIMYAPCGRTAGRAGYPGTIAADLEVDATLGRVEIDARIHRWRLQPQRAGEWHLYLDAHRGPRFAHPSWTGTQYRQGPTHRSLGLHHQRTL